MHRATAIHMMALLLLTAAIVCAEGDLAEQPPAADASGAGLARNPTWPGWRGANRDGLSDDVPDTLPATAKVLWRTELSSMALAGIAATTDRVVLADKSEDTRDDVFLCLDADTGREVWRVAYPAPEEMDYSNSPRATPLIHDGLVYTLGAFGHLHCLRLEDGEIVWKTSIFTDFGADVLSWGACASPLIVDGKLIVNPGAPEASLVALDPKTGAEIWRTPGEGAAYGGFIVGTFGGVRQIVGYDAVSLGGWDVATGTRLWSLAPEYDGDFNVPTPIDFGGRLVVSTENNGTRLYEFGDDGGIIPGHKAQNMDLWPDTISPVLLNGLLFGTQGGLMCLAADDALKTLWKIDDDELYDHASLIAGNGRVLITTQGGEVLLVKAQGDSAPAIQRLRVFEDAEVWSHPALVGDRLYLRNENSIVCLLMRP